MITLTHAIARALSLPPTLAPGRVAPAPAPQRAPIPADTFARSAPAREGLAPQLAAAFDRLDWKAAPAEKIRLLVTIAQLRSDAAADVVLRGYREGLAQVAPVRQAGLARTFQSLVSGGPRPAGGLSAAKHAEVVALLVREFERGGRDPDVRLQLGYGLALSGSEAGADALIAEYRRQPATGAETIHRPLLMLSQAGHPKVSAFLVGEYERLTGNGAARALVLEALMVQLREANR